MRALLAYHAARKANRNSNMKRINLIRIFSALFAATVLGAFPARTLPALGAGQSATAIAVTPFGDPYSDFRNAHYSNAGLLNEHDEIKLGMQLHREVTKK